MSPTATFITRFTILNAFRAGFGAAFRHPLRFAAIGLLVGIPSNMLSTWLVDHFVHGGLIRNFALAIGALLAAYLTLALIHAASASGVAAHLRGAPVTLRDCFKQGSVAMPRLFLFLAWVTAPVWVVMPVMLALGYRPGPLEVYLSLFLLVFALPLVAPIAAGERVDGFGLFRRAWRLYAGARWRFFGTILLMLLVAAIFVALIRVALDFSGLPVSQDANFILLYVAWAFAATPSAAAYYQSRSDKEGMALATVFD